ncbi:MAG: hypothetical protein LC118_14580 [Dehalococcoidia bacterium]|nr:hypothetical protein [Dehalococcoidia bacterium]
MSELRAEPLSPIDAATLWPQLHRLATEVIATRSGENLLVSSGLHATGLTRLPRIARLPRTVVLGVKRGLGYRGVLVSRELSGGAGWEVMSIRIARDKDDDAIIALVNSAGAEVARRGGRTLYLRYAEGSPHAQALRKAGMFACRIEHLYAIPPGDRSGSTLFRTATRTDRHGVFRLYCQSVPENIRRQEAPTQQEWRAVLDSFECDREFVLDRESSIAAWAGIGEREAHLMVASEAEGAADAALNLIETHTSRHASLVIAAHQGDIEHLAVARGYTALGIRVMSARRLALLNPLKEVVAVPAETMPLPH